MDSFFPYDITKLATGPVRIIAAKESDVGSIPSDISQMAAMVDPYAVLANWFDFGAALNPGSYSTSNTQSDLNIEQDVEPVDTEVTAVARSLGFNVAQLSEKAIQIIEQAPSVATIAAASNKGSQKGVAFGSFDELDRYRVAFLGRRRKKAGLVTEPSGKVRGRMFAVLLYSAVITGDAKSFQFAKGSLTGADVTFQAYPASGAPAGQDHGIWLFEDAQTIAP